MTVIRPVLLKNIVAIQVQRETVILQERTIQSDAVILIAGTFSLQTDLRSTPAPIQAQTDFQRQRMLDTPVARNVPSIIVQPLRLTFQIPVTSAPVHVNTCFRRSVPIQIKRQPRIPVLADIVISAVHSPIRRHMLRIIIKDFSVLIGYQAAHPLYSVIPE